MSGIDRKIYLETRSSLIDKHLPGTDKSQRELETEGIVYLFSDRETMERVASEILKRGERTETDGYRRQIRTLWIIFCRTNRLYTKIRWNSNSSLLWGNKNQKDHR